MSPASRLVPEFPSTHFAVQKGVDIKERLLGQETKPFLSLGSAVHLLVDFKPLFSPGGVPVSIKEMGGGGGRIKKVQFLVLPEEGTTKTFSKEKSREVGGGTPLSQPRTVTLNNPSSPEGPGRGLLGPQKSPTMLGEWQDGVQGRVGLSKRLDCSFLVLFFFSLGETTRECLYVCISVLLFF